MSENIPGLDRFIEERGRKRRSAFPCPECDGRGYNYSDPDGKELVCQFCGGEYDDTYDKRMRDAEAEREAQAEAAVEERRGLAAKGVTP